MNQHSCSVCGEGYLHEEVGENTVEYKGKNTVLNTFFAACDVCGVEQTDATHLLKNKRQMIAFKKHVEGLLSGAEVRAIRERLGITQSKASEVFGGGPVAFSKYEKDDVMQSEAMDNLLRMASTSAGFRALEEIVESKKSQDIEHVSIASWKKIKIDKNKSAHVKGQTFKVLSTDVLGLGSDWADLRKCA